MPLSCVCQDIKPHPEGFIISRQFAELTAARFDSLKFYKDYSLSLKSAVDTCDFILRRTDVLIGTYDNQIISLNEQIESHRQVIKSYEQTDKINNKIKQQLRTETRKRKAWQIVGMSALTVLGGALFYIAI